MKSVPLVLVVCLSSLACDASKASPNIPVAAFATPPDVSQVQLSPDGSRIASLHRVSRDGDLGTAVQVFDLESKTGRYVVYAAVDNYVIKRVRWANNDHLLLSARFPEKRNGVPTTETRLVSVNLKNGEIRNVLSSRFLRRQARVPQFQDQIVDMLPSQENHILLQGNFDSVESSRVIKVDITKRTVSRVTPSRSWVRNWVTDRQERVRIAVLRKDTEYRIEHKAVDSKKWVQLWSFESFSEDSVLPLGFDGDPDILYVSAYHEGRRAVFKVNLTDPELHKELVFSDPKYDAGGHLVYSRLSGEVIGLRHSKGGGFTFWSDEHERLQKGIDAALPDTFNTFYSLSDDERRYVVLATSDKEAGAYFIGDRDKKSLLRFDRRYGALDPELMAEKNAIRYEASDGLEIEGFLTYPNGAEGPLPAIIFPHGGPISFDGGGFDYWTQYFASRGYVVLQMNFRGSSGYGYDFMASGLQGWGLEMQKDVEDGTRWLIEEGIADPDRICVVGASYGGYAALMEAARNPDLYQCVVSFAGVTDAAYLVQSYRRYTNYEVVKEQVGDNMRALRERSPINLAEQVDVPVLLGHGTDDRRVRVRHSQIMHRALEKNGKNVKYLEFEGGDHFLSNGEHRLRFFREMDAFLNANLQ